MKGRTLAALLAERSGAQRAAPPHPNPPPQRGEGDKNSSPLVGEDTGGGAGTTSARDTTSSLDRTPAPHHDLPRFLSIFEQVCQTLAYAHSRRVIHRDLKPANIMVGSFGEVQVMDWGLAKVLGTKAEETEPQQRTEPAASVIRTARSSSETQATGTGSILGTLAYMPPEQAGGAIELVDERADVFGLGSILCEILTGQPTYTGPTERAIHFKAMTGDTAGALARIDACGADAELCDLARRCLAINLVDRPRHAGELATAFTAYLSGVQDRLWKAELDRVEAEARAEEETKRRALADELAREAEARAQEEAKARELADSLAREAEARAVEERRRRRVTVGLAASFLALAAPGGLSSAYWAYEHEARAARTELALKEATMLRDQAAAAPEDVAKWEAATRGLEPDARAVGEGGGPDAARRLAKLRAEVAAGLIASRRDAALLRALADDRAMSPELSFGGADSDYARAFRDAGLDFEIMAPSEIGSALKTRPASIAVAAAAGLDEWALQAAGPAPFRQRLAAASVADPDPFRNKVRAELMRLRTDVEAAGAALRGLAADPMALELEPSSAVQLAIALNALRMVEPAVTLLRAIANRHPEDAWVNFQLANLLTQLRPAAREEAVRYYTAARSLQLGRGPA